MIDDTTVFTANPYRCLVADMDATEADADLIAHAPADLSLLLHAVKQADVVRDLARDPESSPHALSLALDAYDRARQALEEAE